MSKSNNLDKIPKELLKRQVDYTAYVKFGKFLLQYLEISKNLTGKNWLNLVELFHGVYLGNRPGLMYINWVICQEFKQDPITVRYNKNKKSNLVLPRQVSMYLAYEYFKYTRKELCDFYEFKQLSSVSNAKTAVINLLSYDKKFNSTIENILDKLLNYNHK